MSIAPTPLPPAPLRGFSDYYKYLRFNARGPTSAP